MTNTKKILLVDDHTIFRSGLAKLLADSQQFIVAADVSTIADAKTSLEQQKNLELVVLDINLGGDNALEHISDLRKICPGIPILIMSMYPAQQFAPAAYKAGANGYLSKDAAPHELFNALSLLSQGQDYLLPSLQGPNPNISSTDNERCYPHDWLSERELEILKFIADGYSLTCIGQKMFLSVKTVSTYRSRILEKLNISNNAELIKYALTHGLTLS